MVKTKKRDSEGEGGGFENILIIYLFFKSNFSSRQLRACPDEWPDERVWVRNFTKSAKMHSSQGQMAARASFSQGFFYFKKSSKDK